MFLDCEGEPIQELSAIAMDNESFQIISVFHKHAECHPKDDKWSRKHIHGLNRNYLSNSGYSNENDLVTACYNWLKSFKVVVLYANNPSKERKLFPKYSVFDMFLPSWEDRMNQPYHVLAHRFKFLNVPILNTRCSAYVHAEYLNKRWMGPSLKDMAKVLHGYHCSLYDCYELYLFFLFQTKDL